MANSQKDDAEKIEENQVLAKQGKPDFVPIGDFEKIFLERIAVNVRRQNVGYRLINAALNCGADAVRFLKAVIEGLRAGSPIPVFGHIMTEANFRAEMTTRQASGEKAIKRAPSPPVDFHPDLTRVFHPELTQLALMLCGSRPDQDMVALLFLAGRGG